MIKKYFALTLISASLLAVGCSSDDDDDDGGTDSGTTTGTTTGDTGGDTGGGGPTPAVLPDGATYDPTTLDPAPTQNLAELAGAAGLNQLVQAVTNSCPDLVTALTSADSRLTVFGPTDAAFGAQEVTDALAAPGADVCAVVSGHVLVGTVAAAADLQSQVGTVATTLAGNTVAIAQDGDGNLTIGGAVVSGADNFATNGVAHVIDSVILPAADGGDTGETGADGADGGDTGADGGDTGGTTGGSELGASLSAVQSSGNTQFVELWQTASLGLALDDNAWTVFAPTDDAIDDGVFATVNADQTSAFNLLNGHIITTGALSSDDLGAVSEITVNTGTVYPVVNDNGAITVNGLAVTPIATTGNATVYSLDGVLQ